MDFELCCDCGQYVCVPEGAAGASVQCTCGRTVAVPQLAELRRQAGLPSHQVSAAVLIEHMLGDGELPTATICVRCDAPTDEVVDVTAECEKATESEPSGMLWVIAFLFIGIWAILLREREGREFGRNLILHLPVRICRSCQGRLAYHPLASCLGWLALGLALAGVVTWILWSSWGALLLAGSIFLWVAGTVVKARRRGAILGS